MNLASARFHWSKSARPAKRRTRPAKIHCAARNRLRRVTANLTIDVGVFSRGRFRREGRERVEPPRPSKIPAARLALEHGVDAPRQSAVIARGNENPRALVLNDVAQST